MKAKLFTFVLLIVLTGQSVSMARSGMSVDFLADLPHAILHWQSDAHHHDEDGGYRQDDAGESAQHLIADYVMGAPALIAEVAAFSPMKGTGVPAGQHVQFLRNPFLEGPLRPPRSTT